jgi:ABC-type multidrug transport system fused ATPase/permease subunit
MELTDFRFEYSRQSIIVRLLFIAVPTFITLFISTFFILQYIGLLTCIILTIVVPILIFYLNRKKIKANGRAILTADRVTFELVDNKVTYEFKDIKSYTIQYYHGLALNLRLKEGKKFRLLANDNFCKPEKFSKFCRAFEKTLDTFESLNKTSSIRGKSIFEKQWFFVLLITLTALAIGALIYASLADKAKPGSILISIGALISLWTGYFATKTSRKISR